MSDRPTTDDMTKPSGEQKAPDKKEYSESECAAVKLWTKRIKDAKKHWEKDFKRMRENMEFCGGIQWKGQQSVDDDKGRYIANITQRNVNEKVASLYARNPKAEYQRRKRLDFQVWDGKMDSILQATQAIGLQTQQGIPLSMPAMAMLQDFSQGQERRKLVDKVGNTLEIVYQWQIDEQEPDFKEQMKDFVTFAVCCGVGFVKMGFEREYTSSVDTMDVHSTVEDRMKKAQHIMGKYTEGKIDDTSPLIEELKCLLYSLQESATNGEMQDVSERLVFSFPSPVSIIVDPKCTSLKGFKGARWIAEEHILPLEEVNEFFESDIKPESTFQHYTPDGKPEEVKDPEVVDVQRAPLVCLWEVYDLRTKSHFFVVDGYKKYVQEPQPVEPNIRRFWPVFALTFNNVVVTPNQKVTIYPASDVQGMMSAQKEWNRTREAMRAHRKANAPKYVTGAQWLTEADRDKVESGVENALIELQGAQSGADIEKLIRPFPSATIQPQMYDTSPLQQDVLLTQGSQQANLGPLTGATATEANIGEQSKMSTTTSDIDNLNNVLTSMAKAGGEMLLRDMSPEQVQRIAGPGAAWPTNDREEFINEIDLIAVAGSSGRPNMQMEVQKFERLVPLMLQAGANPLAIIEEAVHRLDDNLEVERFFPVPIPPVGPQPQQGGQPGPQQPAGKPTKSPARKPQPPMQPGQFSRPPQPAGP